MSYGYLSRAFQTTTGTGTGDLDLEAPPAGRVSLVDAVKFASGVGTGPWAVEIVVEDTTDWERWVLNVEEGTGSGGKDRIKRSTGTLKDSTNSGAPVVWGSNTKNVFASPTEEKAGALFDKLSTNGWIRRVAASESYVVDATTAYSRALISAGTAQDWRDGLVCIGRDFADQTLLTSVGDLLYMNTGPAEARLAIGSTNQLLGVASGKPAWLGYTPTTPLTATTFQAAIDQLAHRYSHTAQTSSKTGVTTEDELDDLQGIAIPGGGDSAKVYRALGQVTVTGLTSGRSATVRVRRGATGDKTDAVECFTIVSSGINSPNDFTLTFISRPFVPASGHKVTITLESSGGCDVANDATKTFVTIEQISNA